MVVSGHGAMVVNNTPRNIPWYLPERARGLLVGYLGSNPERLTVFKSLCGVPISVVSNMPGLTKKLARPAAFPVGMGSNRVYFIGARDNEFTLEALDWETGSSDFHYVIGGQRYNVMYSGTIDEDGRIHYGTPWGRVRLMPKTSTEMP